MENQELDSCPSCVTVSIHLNFLIYLLLKNQVPRNSVQNLSQEEIMLGIADVTPGRFPTGCVMSGGNGIVSNESLLYLDIVFKKLLHLSSISAFPLL